MPIRPENKARYPKDWKKIRARILDRAKHCCEFCGVPNYVYRFKGEGALTETYTYTRMWPEQTRIVLTIAHLDHIPEHCGEDNLRALCQRCHLAYDAQLHQQNSYETRRKGKAIADLFEESRHG